MFAGLVRGRMLSPVVVLLPSQPISSITTHDWVISEDKGLLTCRLWIGEAPRKANAGPGIDDLYVCID